MVPTLTMQAQITARAISRLTDAYRNQPNVQGFLKALVSPFGEIESVAWSIINQRMLSVLVPMVAAGQNTGTQLDLIGALVGETRQGRTDAQYLPAIQLRIRVNRSQGRGEDILQIANLLNPGSTYRNAPTFAWEVYSWNIQTWLSVATFTELLSQAKASSSRGVLLYSTWPSSENLIGTSVYGGVTATTFGDSVYGGVTSAGLGVASQQVPDAT